MKMLHLYSNWKWTGPAEHALNLALYLTKRGHDLTFACGRAPHAVDDSLEKRAQEGGIRLMNEFHLNKHFNIWQDTIDIVRLAHLINDRSYELIHTHLFNDHFIAGAAKRIASKRIPLIRTVYEGEGVLPSVRNRVLFSYGTDGVIAVSELSQRRMRERFYFPAERIWTISPGVDGNRFNQGIEGSSVRTRFGVAVDDPLIGMAARVQPHRRFDVFLKAISTAVHKVPTLKVFIIGRGTHIQKVAMEPAEALGLKDRVIFTGYRMEDYPRVLASLDVKVFLVPGTDGSCRAVKEAMAMGKPVIVARRGMLPEIVEDGVSGMVVDDTPENLANAIITLVSDVSLRKKMGEAARERVTRYFNLETQLLKVEEMYRKVIG